MTGNVRVRDEWTFDNPQIVAYDEFKILIDPNSENITVPSQLPTTLGSNGQHSSGGVSDIVFCNEDQTDCVAPAGLLEYESGTNGQLGLIFEARFSGIERDNLDDLVMRFEHSVNVPNVGYEIELFNWFTREYEQVASGISAVQDEPLELELTSDISSYVKSLVGSGGPNGQYGDIRAQVTWTRPQAGRFKLKIDQLVWLSTVDCDHFTKAFFDDQNARFDQLLDEYPDPTLDKIKLLYADFVSGYPFINNQFWLRDFDFSGITRCRSRVIGDTCEGSFAGPGIFNFNIGQELLPKELSVVDTNSMLITPQVIMFVRHQAASVTCARHGDLIWVAPDGNIVRGYSFTNNLCPNNSNNQVGDLHCFDDLILAKLDNPIPPETQIRPFRIAAAHHIAPERFQPSGSLEDAKVIVQDGGGSVFLAKIDGYGNLDNFLGKIMHHRLMSNEYPNQEIRGDSGNPLFFLGPGDELVLCGLLSNGVMEPIFGFDIDRINDVIHNQFGLPNQSVEVFDFRNFDQ